MTYIKKKIGIISLGCPKNLVDTEIMLGLLNEAGFEITNKKEDADILIVNTCGFVESAKKESIDVILEMAECKKDKCELLIITGCLVERYRDELMKAVPEADAFLGTGGYGEIVGAINNLYSSGKTAVYPKLDDVSYLENNRLLSSDKGYAYLKISEGCSNRCTYCIIPSLRGPYRSRRIQDIVKEAGILVESGKKEIILISQDTTSYGMDIYNRRSLVRLIRNLSEINGVKWIRLLYCYPGEIDDGLIHEFEVNDRLCKYLDMPVQHINDRILKAMGRRDSADNMKKLISRLRGNIPGIAIRTSLIVGFPGETENDFKELLDFVEMTEFDRLGVFTYSREEGTKAADFKSQVSKSKKEKRFHDIMRLQHAINLKKNRSRLGKKCEVIVDGCVEKNIYYGRSASEAPDIDWILYFKGHNQFIGDIIEAEIIDIV
jgi:ribosomal protein S12 methylthiotransferase